VTELREQNGWLLFLLPFLGLISVFTYKLFKTTDIGTNQVLEAVNGERNLPVLLYPAIFIGTLITHLCGGSAGKEGAALQLGGSLAALISKIFKLKANDKQMLTVCGMAGLFSAAFGTPLGACVFALEVIYIGHIYYSALLPAFISSLVSHFVATNCGLEPERFVFSFNNKLELNILWKALVIALLGAIVSFIFCKALHLSEKYFKKSIKNPYIRIFVGGIILVFLSLISRTNAYNGSGINIISEIFANGEVQPEAFLIKIIFTAVTVAAGFKGGEIVPTMFIGSSLGGSLALILGLEPALGAAIGLAALLSGVTKCPFATVFLCAELLGANTLLFIFVPAILSFLLSGHTGLYTKKGLFAKPYNTVAKL